jgi:hypothetical protein
MNTEQLLDKIFRRWTKAVIILFIVSSGIALAATYKDGTVNFSLWAMGIPLYVMLALVLASLWSDDLDHCDVQAFREEKIKKIKSIRNNQHN